MHNRYRYFVLAGLVICTGFAAADPPKSLVRFEAQDLAKDLSIGYAAAIADINGDSKPDIVVVDKHRVIWYENPSWKVRTILQGKTRPDNVCLCVLDIDGDGQLDIVLGADWAPFNTKSGGTLHWLRRGKTLDDEWTMFPIGEEPTVHRVRVAHLDGTDAKPLILLGPLMGRESTKDNNWMDGRPVRMLAYPIPTDPVKGPWKPVAIDESLHVVHNFWPIAPEEKDGTQRVLAASYEGVSLIERSGEKSWKTTRIGAGNQANPKGNRGASEIKMGYLLPKEAKFSRRQSFIATVEPWHGNQIVVYTEEKGADGLLKRFVIDDELRWGHAVWCADLDGDGADELIIGVRDNPAATDKHKLRCGVRVYKCTDGKGEQWERQVVEDGGVAVEDLAAADLDGDGKVDIVAVGRQTKNARIYWNKGK